MEDVFPQVAFTILGGIPVRDTVVSTWVMMAIVVLLVLLARWRSPATLEMLVDFLNDTLTEVMGQPAAPYLPLLGALGIFIAAANVVGIVPFIYSPTRGINTPLALALVVFFSVHYFGIRAKGVVTYLKDMASPIFLLPLEMVGQLSRTLSLTVRLFGNILSAELIVAVIFALVPLLVPIPLMGFSILTSLLQAYIFTALAAVYISAGVQAGESPANKTSKERNEKQK